MKYKIISHFLKDISFEIPKVETYLLLEKEIKKYSITFDIKSEQFKKNIIQVDTTLKLVAKQEVKRKIHVEITVRALASFEGDLKDKQSLEKIILIKIPKEIYPNLIDILSYLFTKSGIKDFNTNKNVDFEGDKEHNTRWWINKFKDINGN